MAACNPFRVVESSIEDELECKFELNENRKYRLSHRVNPLKLSLLDFVWDYGALSPQVEKEYIRRILKGSNSQIEILKEVVFVSHIYIKNEVEQNQSSVSLRDIDRVNKIFHFCVVLLQKTKKLDQRTLEECLVEYERNFASQELPEDIFFESLCLTIGINYYFRLYKQGTRTIHGNPRSPERNAQADRTEVPAKRTGQD